MEGDWRGALAWLKFVRKMPELIEEGVIWLSKIPGATPKEYVVLEPDAYEAVIVGCEVVVNEWYKPAEQDSRYKTRIEWTFKLRDVGLEDIPNMKKWTPSHLSDHHKATLAPFLVKIDPDFDIKEGFDTEDYIDRPIRLLIETKMKDYDGVDKPTNTIAGILPSKLGELSGEEVLKYKMGATEVDVW